MYVIRHYDVSVEGAKAPRSHRVQLFRDQACNLGLAKVDGSATGCVEQPIKSDECLAGSCMLTSEDALLWQASP
jgi:hypothetical protein